MTADDGITCSKERSKYTIRGRKITHGNSQALNVIFSGVDLNQFQVIYMCESTKEAWTILQNQHERNDVVCMSRIWTTKFEKFKILKNKTIFEFYAGLFLTRLSVLMINNHSAVLFISG